MKLNNLLLITTILLFASCASNDETCRDETRVVLRAGLFSSESSALSSIDSLTIIGIPDGTVYYNNSKSINKIELPLVSSGIATEFAIRFNEKWDTLTVLHSSNPYFVSYACGIVYIHEIDTVLIRGSVSKSLKIDFKTVNNQNVQHLQIYR